MYVCIFRGLVLFENLTSDICFQVPWPEVSTKEIGVCLLCYFVMLLTMHTCTSHQHRRSVIFLLAIGGENEVKYMFSENGRG